MPPSASQTSSPFLQAEERETLQMQEKLSQLQEEKTALLNSLVEAE
jgi:hypothetical protein